MDRDWSYSELAELTHETQVENFNWCGCEEQEYFPYEDCPRQEEESQTLYLAEMTIGSYFCTALDTTPEKVLRALKAEYETKNLGEWKCGGMTWEEWADYCAITPTPIEIGKVDWK